VPGGAERYGSAVASFGLDWRSAGGDFRFHLAADTGEVRRRSAPATADVCLNPLSPTGLSPPGVAGCLDLRQRRVVVLDTTGDGPSRLTFDGRPAGDELRDTWLLREVYGTVALGRAGFARFTFGRKRVTVGDGLVHDEGSAVAAMDLDVGAIGPPLELSLAALVPDRAWPTAGVTASPMVAASAAWQVSLFDRVGVFVAWLRDRSDAVAETLRGQALEQQVTAYASDLATPAETGRKLALALGAPLHSDARLLWFGSSGAFTPGRGQRLSWTLAALEGRIDEISVPQLVILSGAEVHGRAVQAGWDVDLPGGLSAGLAFLWLSGGTLPTGDGGRYDGFLGVAPYVPHTNLFFRAGLASTFAAREVAAPGVNGRGVLSPAARLSWDPADDLGLDAKVAWLRADRTGPFGGKDYGVELDLAGTWRAAPWLELALEADALWPGDFYGGGRTVYKTVLAVDVLTP